MAAFLLIFKDRSLSLSVLCGIRRKRIRDSDRDDAKRRTRMWSLKRDQPSEERGSFIRDCVKRPLVAATTTTTTERDRGHRTALQKRRETFANYSPFCFYFVELLLL